MAKTQRTLVVGVFEEREKAQQAVNELRQAGFSEDEIGVAARDGKTVKGTTKVKKAGTKVEEGAVVGLAAGAGVGTLWGLGILAGALPVIGPAIAGGTLATILTSAAAGAATASLAGALIGFGIPEEEAEFYEKEFQAGRIIVTVKAGRRAAQAREILSRFSAFYVESQKQTQTTPTASRGLDARTEHLRPIGTKKRKTSQTGTPARGRASATSEGETIQIKEEEIQIKKRPVKKGEVRVRKEVHVEPRTVEVPVTREEVVIERRPVRREASPTKVGIGEEIRIPVHEEQVHVEKRPVVTQEVTVRKRKVPGSRRVSSTVRKEQVHIEKEGDVNVRGESDPASR